MISIKFPIIFSILLLPNLLISQTTKIKSEAVLVDQSGNTYKTVKIGNQVWMAENLRAKNYLNGDKIDEVKYNDINLNSKCKDPIFCILKNENYFYSFQTIIDNRGIAPFGWHVPTKSDWEELLSNSNNVLDFKSISGWPYHERLEEEVVCPICKNWNSEYRSNKRGCDRCQDTRRIKSGKYLKLPSLNGNNRLKFNMKHVGVFTPFHDLWYDGFWASDFSSDVFDTIRKFFAYSVFMYSGVNDLPKLSHGSESSKLLLPVRLIKNKE